MYTNIIRAVLYTLACTNVVSFFYDDLHAQHEGMSMGSILGPTMATFALDMMECKFTEFNGAKPVFLFRYVRGYSFYHQLKEPPH